MYTVCSKCTLTLAVTANDLRLGQGYVRCGRCGNVFNALLTLNDELSELAAAAPASVPTFAPPATATAATAATSRSVTATDIVPPRQVDELLSTPTQEVPEPPPAMHEAAPPAAANDQTSEVRFEADHPGHAEPVRASDPTDSVEVPPRAQRAIERAAERHQAEQGAPEALGDGGIVSSSSTAMGTGTFETIILEGDAITQTEEYVPEETVDHEIAEFSRRIGRTGDLPPPTAHAGASETRAPEPLAALRAPARAPDEHDTENLASSHEHHADEAAADTPAHAPDDAPIEESSADTVYRGMRIEYITPRENATESEPTSPYDDAMLPRARRRYVVIGVALAVLLALQAVHHWRYALAASPVWGGAVTRVYHALGMTVEAPIDLSAYDVRQQGAVADPGASDAIHVRLSLANRSAHKAPAPLLRLTLLDRYGKPVASRDLPPAEYWPAGHPAPQFLASDERVDGEVTVHDPGSDSASFEIDVCLRDAQGALHCAGDESAAEGGHGAAPPTASR